MYNVHPSLLVVGVHDLASATFLAATAAWLAAIVAIATLIIEDRRARTLLRIDLLFRFEDQFNSERFRKVRSAAASAVSRNAKDYRDVDEVIDFFETMGLMAHNGALDLEMVWNNFYVYIDGWWCSIAGYVREAQDDDEFTWEYFVELWQRLTEIEKKKTGNQAAALTWSYDEIKGFLDDEHNLAKPPRRGAKRTKKKTVGSCLNLRSKGRHHKGRAQGPPVTAAPKPRPGGRRSQHQHLEPGTRTVLVQSSPS